MPLDYLCRNWTPFLLLSCFVLSLSGVQLAEADSNFTISGEEYVCDGNIICLGDAHIYTGENSHKHLGRLSLTHTEGLETGGISAGIAYYKEPIRLLDPGARSSASFNTSFQFHKVPGFDNQTVHYAGDGLTFVLSADNSVLGDKEWGQNFGFFDHSGLASFKSVVAEFDIFQNVGPIVYDINDNHVSIDIHNITAVATKNALDVGIQLKNETPVYAWVEYSDRMQTLEVRISYQKSRPLSPFLSLQRFNLSEVIEEYMWVGFTAGSADLASSYYIGNWSFESYGIPAEVYHKLRARKQSSIVLGETISAVVVIIAFVSIIFCFLRRRSAQLSGDDHEELHPLQEECQYEGHRFSHEELSEATRGFAEELMLGEGGSGSVYRGKLRKSNIDTPVAVKRINTTESEQAEREFKAEVSIISQLRHRNLIQLLGWCIEEGKRYVVYDLMANGSLDKVLFTDDHERSAVLPWQQRYKIIQGAASAVEYLHNGSVRQVIHRDIKASNILLDDQWNAKLGDFGLARSADHEQTLKTTVVAGTPGYLAPEVGNSGRFTEKTDVFAFGVLALEMACGRRAVLMDVPDEKINLVHWVRQCYEAGDLSSVVDRRLSEFDKSRDESQIKTLLWLGLNCSHPDPFTRPSMRVVVQVLYGDAPVPTVRALRRSGALRIRKKFLPNWGPCLRHVKPTDSISLLFES